MKKNWVLSLCMLAALTLTMPLSSCSDDDEDEDILTSTDTDDDTSSEDNSSSDSENSEDSTENNNNSTNDNADYDPIADVGFITTEDGEELLVSSVTRDGSSWLSYNYNNTGLPKSAKWGSSTYSVSYNNPTKITGNGYTITLSFNYSGYVKKLTCKRTIDASSSYIISETTNFSYDESGHLIQSSSSYTESYVNNGSKISSSYSLSSNFTWVDGDLTEVLNYSNGKSTSTIDLSYTSTENKYQQPTMALLMYAFEDAMYSSDLFYVFGYFGYFGVGSAHLPNSSSISTKSLSPWFSYDLNSDGTINKEIVNGSSGDAHNYNYSYTSMAL